MTLVIDRNGHCVECPPCVGVHDRHCPRHRVYGEADRAQLDIAYGELANVLALFPHDEECAYRCLNQDCHVGHGCAICDIDEERDPIEVYGTPEHEAWLMEMERTDSYQ